MRIIVVGAGEVGSYIAKSLSLENVDVTVIEKNAARLDALSQGLDILSVRGNALDHKVLKTARLKNAFMLVAVTNSDEVNMMVCLMAAQAGVKHRIVRIENDYLGDKEMQELRETMQIDVVVNPDRETVLEIMELLSTPGVAELEELGGGELVLIGAQLTEDSPLAHRTLAQIAKENEPDWNFMVGAISRKADTLIPRDTETMLQPGDTVRVITKKEYQKNILKQLGATQSPIKNVMILGAGRIGESAAVSLESKGFKIKLIDRDSKRAVELSENNNNIDIICGDIADSDLLDREGIEKMDAVVAVSGRDESNILACLYAKSKEVKEIITILHRPELKNMFAEFGLEKTLSPITASIEPVLKIVRSGKIKTDVKKVTSFLAMDVEVLEITIVQGSKADGKTVREIKPSKKILIGAISNKEGTKIARGDTRLSAGDNLVVFARPNALGKVSELFETKQ